jgi:hypothetical protein
VQRLTHKHLNDAPKRYRGHDYSRYSGSTFCRIKVPAAEPALGPFHAAPEPYEACWSECRPKPAEEHEHKKQEHKRLHSRELEQLPTLKFKT